MTRRLPFTILIFLISTALTFSTLNFLFPTSTLLSPLPPFLDPLATKLGLTTPRPQKIIFGFLPFWNLQYADHFNYHLITHLAYFGLDYQPDGTIQTHTDQGYLEPGWRQLSSSTTQDALARTKAAGGSTILVLRAMTQDIITSIVNDPDHRATLISSTLDVLTQHQFDGLNIDFEYSGTPDAATRTNFTLLVQQLSQSCRTRLPSCQVSLSVFADAATKNRLWDLPTLSPHLDHVVIMAYDFYRAASTQAGPVAPLRGSCSSLSTGSPFPTPSHPCLNYDVAQTVADFSKILPPDQLLLGVPYYGYQWQTASSQFLANTYPQTGALATYRRVQTILASAAEHPRLRTYWQDSTLSPWLEFTDTAGRVQQIHYENTTSLGLKYDLVNQSDLAGIAIWALGYDSPYPDLWELLATKFLP